ncbi:MAG: hypothetical protein M3Y53_10790 [Thermoproteota archaeon]|nr:hypothetical protein [Thermoproteota archaeon]
MSLTVLEVWELKNAGMTAPQCAMGLRIAQIMQSFGIDEENFRAFISDLYQHCTEIGLRPQKVAENVKRRQFDDPWELEQNSGRLKPTSARDHVDSPDLGVARNSADIERGITDRVVIAGLVSKAFPLNPLTFVGGKYPHSLHKEDLEDLREMQELAAGQARGGQV